jgi:hypothetical protein
MKFLKWLCQNKMKFFDKLKFWREKHYDSDDKTKITQEEWLRIKFMRAEREFEDYIKEKKIKNKKVL